MIVLWEADMNIRDLLNEVSNPSTNFDVKPLIDIPINNEALANQILQNERIVVLEKEIQDLRSRVVKLENSRVFKEMSRTRNTCIDHKRKHQKCPWNCSNRGKSKLKNDTETSDEDYD